MEQELVIDGVAYMTLQGIIDLPTYEQGVYPLPDDPVKKWKTSEGPNQGWLLLERTPFSKPPGYDVKQLRSMPVEEVIRIQVDRIMKAKSAAVEQPGPAVGSLTEIAPQVMAELMKKFIDNRDLNSRAQIRLQMKAMLDMFSSNTGYPPIPSISAPRMARGAFVAPGGFGVQNAPGGDYMLQGAAVPPLRHAGEVDLLRREVQEAVNEEAVAAEPADLIPAPGAAVARPRVF